MKKVFILILCLVLMLILATACYSSTEGVTNQQDINDIINLYQSAFKSGNIDQITGCINYPFNWWFAKTPYTTADQLKVELQKIYATVSFSAYEIVDRQFAIKGDNATVTCTEHAKNEKEEFSKTSVISLIKTDSGWKIASFQYKTS